MNALAQVGMLATCAALATASALWVPRLPEPPDTGDGVLPRYHRLGSPPMVGMSAVLGAVAGGCASTTSPALWPVLVGFAGIGASLTLVDLRTTFLPRQLTWACWALTGAGAVATALLVDSPSALAGRWAIAALATSALFWLFWRLGGMGFGDVRLAPVLGVCASVRSLDEWYLALVATGALGVALGLGSTWWRRRHPSELGTAFAYAPAMWAGCWLALVIPWLG